MTNPFSYLRPEHTAPPPPAHITQPNEGDQPPPENPDEEFDANTNAEAGEDEVDEGDNWVLPNPATLPTTIAPTTPLDRLVVAALHASSPRTQPR